MWELAMLGLVMESEHEKYVDLHHHEWCMAELCLGVCEHSSRLGRVCQVQQSPLLFTTFFVLFCTFLYFFHDFYFLKVVYFFFKYGKYIFK